MFRSGTETRSVMLNRLETALRSASLQRSGSAFAFRSAFGIGLGTNYQSGSEFVSSSRIQTCSKCPSGWGSASLRAFEFDCELVSGSETACPSDSETGSKSQIASGLMRSRRCSSDCCSEKSTGSQTHFPSESDLRSAFRSTLKSGCSFETR